MRELFARLAFERFSPLRDHALDGFGVVALVGRQEGDRVAGRNLEEIGLEHHRTLITLIEHLDLVVSGLGAGALEKSTRNTSPFIAKRCFNWSSAAG